MRTAPPYTGHRKGRLQKPCTGPARKRHQRGPLQKPPTWPTWLRLTTIPPPGYGRHADPQRERPQHPRYTCCYKPHMKPCFPHVTSSCTSYNKSHMSRHIMHVTTNHTYHDTSHMSQHVTHVIAICMSTLKIYTLQKQHILAQVTHDTMRYTCNTSNGGTDYK